MSETITATVSQVQHRVSLDLHTPQPLTDILGRTRLVQSVRIEYGLSSITDRVDVVVEYEDCAQLLPPVTPIPAWLRTLIDQHRPEGPASNLH
jgi:hypothetical protein